jgi:hypothetical protein
LILKQTSSQIISRFVRRQPFRTIPNVSSTCTIDDGNRLSIYFFPKKYRSKPINLIPESARKTGEKGLKSCIRKALEAKAETIGSGDRQCTTRRSRVSVPQPEKPSLFKKKNQRIRYGDVKDPGRPTRFESLSVSRIAKIDRERQITAHTMAILYPRACQYYRIDFRFSFGIS